MDCRSVLRHAKGVPPLLPDFEANGTPLGSYLTDRFLACEIGTEKLYYDHDSETLFVPDANEAYRRIRAKLDKIAIVVHSPERVKAARGQSSPSKR